MPSDVVSIPISIRVPTIGVPRGAGASLTLPTPEAPREPDFIKDPDETLDYEIDWGALWLAEGETITDSTWEVTAGIGLTIGANSFTDTTTLVWISDGVIGEVYVVTNHIVTSALREKDQSLLFWIENL